MAFTLCRGGGLREKNAVYYGVYYGLLRILRTFIKEIMVLLQVNWIILKRLSQIGPKDPTFGGEIGQNRNLFYYYYGYYGILQILHHFYCVLRKITVRNVPPLLYAK